MKLYAKHLLSLLLCSVLGATAVQAQPNFTKEFSPPDIGPGGSSLLTFTIENPSGVPASSLAFTDVLPAGVTLASPANAITDCVATTLTAPDGGGTITLSDGNVPGSTTCTISVLVTSSTPGTHMNVTSDLTSSAGNSGDATDDLTVSTDRPGFSKSFSPTSIAIGERSTLTFTIDNTLNGSMNFSISFTDSLPTGVVIADPANTSNTCTGGALTAIPGSSSISYTPAFPGDASVAAATACTLTVDVVGVSQGSYVNVSNNLSSVNLFLRNSGLAVDEIEITADTLLFSKAFLDDPVNPGDTVDLEFTINSRDRDRQASSIAFTDDLDATLSGLVATGLPLMDVCGSGSMLSGSSLLTLTGGVLNPSEACTFTVTLQVPAAATAGIYPNTTSSLTADLEGTPYTGDPATEPLFVNDAPTLTKTFLDNPIGAGGTTTVEFTITNTSSTSAATDIAFQDNITQFNTGASVSALPAAGFCGPGSIAFVTPVSGSDTLFVQGANLAASDSCTFTVDFLIPSNTAPGDYVNTTGNISATVDGTTQQGGTASDTLTVVPSPSLQKLFTDDPAQPGDTLTLEFTLSHNEFAPADATGITFTDNLDAALSGLVATGLPLSNICGAGSMISGTSTLTFTGGTLAPGASCTFSVTVQTPALANSGTYTNVTSTVDATVSGLPVVGAAASDSFLLTGLEFTKSFPDSPVLPGATTILRFTINNTGTTDATGMVFTDNLTTALSGLNATNLPANPCGVGSSITGTTFLIFFGGNLLAGESCTFDVEVEVPSSTPNDTYTNLTSNLTATIGGSSAVLPAAAANLTVDNEILTFTKAFLDDPVNPGDTVMLQFSITNTSVTESVTGITFTDDLDAALSGLVATGLPATDVCGIGSNLSGTSTITLTGGSLAPGASCVFVVTLQVPMNLALGAEVTNTTSAVTGTSSVGAVAGPPASAELLVNFLLFSKTFDGPTTAGGTPTLTFNIVNLSATEDATGIGFTDDLDATLSGLVATGLPSTNDCGTGSTLDGTSFLTFTNGTVDAGSACNFSVSLQVPPGATAGTYPNTTSDLVANGLTAGLPAMSDLTIEPPPTFTKAFSPDAIGQGQTSTLTFTIDNNLSSVSVSSMAFTDNLPAGMVVASSPNPSNTCLSGSLTAVPGTGTISYSGGNLGDGADCTLSVDVTATVTGALVNTTEDLTSSSGNSGTATDTLTVDPQPGFSKAFAPAAVASGGTSTLTFTIDNSASVNAATALDFTDNLPTGMEVASPANASTTCTGGTLTAVAGATSVTYTGGSVAAGTPCTVSVDVTPTITSGDLVNTTGDLTSSLGNSGTATDTLTVDPAPGFAKAFAPTAVPSLGTSTLTFTIDNSAAVNDATTLDFTDNLPTGMEVASPANASTTCTGGTITATAGATSVTYSGGSVTAGTSCTVSVDVTPTVASGDLVNTSGDLTSSLGNSGTATATLTVDPAPGFAKAFAPASVVVGSPSTLTFTIDNSGSLTDGTALDFTDNLPAGMEVASPANASTTCTGGTITATAGATSVNYTGGSVTAGMTCTVSVDVTPTVAGALVNTSEDLTSSLGNSGTATDTLTVTVDAPTFAKSFAPAVIGVDGISTLTLTITNGNIAPVPNLAFVDNLPAEITIATPANANNTCGGTLTATAGTGTVSLTGGTVGASTSCTVSVDVTSSTLGTHTNLTGDLTSDGGNSGTATADLMVVADIGLTKTTIQNPVLAGGTVLFEYTVMNPSVTDTLTAITFTDDLDTALTGLAATGLPATDVCGAGSTVSGGAIVTLTGGNLGPGSSCTFQVSVVVPTDAAAGTYPSTTGAVSGDVGGDPVTGGTASSDVEVVYLTFTKAFDQSSVIGGTPVGLTFTLSNPDPVNDATGLTFTDDLDAFIPGLVATDTPLMDICGAGSELSGTSLLTFTGGTVPAGGSCSFTVTLLLPGDATGTFVNVTSPLDGSVGGSGGDPAGSATANLVAAANPVAIPTLDTWALVFFALLLATLARRRLASEG